MKKIYQSVAKVEMRLKQVIFSAFTLLNKKQIMQLVPVRCTWEQNKNFNKNNMDNAPKCP